MAQVNIHSDDEKVMIDISEDFTVTTINEVKMAFEEALAASNSVEISLKDVEEFDSAAFQLLYSFLSELQKDGIDYHISDMSKPVKNILLTYDMEL